MSGDKSEAILAAARSAFLELGYEGASMGDIVKRACVSKGTVYNYYEDKEALFTAFIKNECETRINLVTYGDPQAADLEAELHRMARELVALLAGSTISDIFRVIVSESGRFPSIANVFFKNGPQRCTLNLVKFFKEVSKLGRLEIDCPVAAGNQFRQLCEGDLFLSRLCRLREEFTDAEIDEEAQRVVKMFLARHRRKS